MPARDHRAAVEGYLDRLRAIASCITNRPIIAPGFRPSSEPYQLSFAPLRERAPLRAGARRFLLDLDRAYRVFETSAGTVEVATIAYRFHILDRRGAEIVAFH